MYKTLQNSLLHIQVLLLETRCATTKTNEGEAGYFPVTTDAAVVENKAEGTVVYDQEKFNLCFVA